MTASPPGRPWRGTRLVCGLGGRIERIEVIATAACRGITKDLGRSRRTLGFLSGPNAPLGLT